MKATATAALDPKPLDGGKFAFLLIMALLPFYSLRNGQLKISNVLAHHKVVHHRHHFVSLSNYLF